jgi:hypothetical protein
MPRPQGDWKIELENRLMAKVRAVAKQSHPGVLDVELDLHHGVIRVTTSRMLPQCDRKIIQQNVLSAIQSEFHTDGIGFQQLRINVRPPFSYPHTVHSLPLRNIVKPLGSPARVNELSIKVSDLQSLQEAYDTLQTHAYGNDYVVTCARGGMPAMNYMAMGDLERNKGVETEKTLEGLKDKYHIFPGMAWATPTPDAKSAMACWLDGLPGGASLLFFDTGRMGNGPRAFFNFLVEEYIPSAEAQRPARVTILGVVDGISTDQQPDIREVANRLGEKTMVTIDYIRVPWVVTEDIEILLGHELIVKEGLLQPVSGTMCVNLVDEQGGNLLTFGTTAAAAILSSWLRRELRLKEQTGPTNSFAPEASVAVIDAVFVLGYEYEKTEIDTAAACGLITKALAKKLLTGLGKKYRRLFPSLRQRTRAISKKH